MISTFKYQCDRFKYNKNLIKFFDEIQQKLNLESTNIIVKISATIPESKSKKVLEIIHDKPSWTKFKIIDPILPKNFEKYQTSHFTYQIKFDNTNELIDFIKQDIDNYDMMIESPTPKKNDVEEFVRWTKIKILYPGCIMIFYQDKITIEIEEIKKFIIYLVIFLKIMIGDCNK